MSATLIWDWSLASADGLLTNEECSLLLDADILNDDDLLKTFPSAASKVEPGVLLQDDTTATLYPPSPVESKPNRADIANDLLQQLDNQCKQENIFSNWLEEKVELPLFENISQLPERVELPQPALVQPAYITPQPTEELLREFETVYGAVELTHLTPPQSPPGPATQLLLSYAQQTQCPQPSTVPTITPPTQQWTTASIPDLSFELQDVEEIVRYRASELTFQHSSPESSSTSPRSTPPSSPRSSTDEDWTTPRPKPYSRSVDDRRSRKKEQNKNAATRYRQKKKAEVEVLLSEEQTLRQRHTELGNKCSDLQREIGYLKGLMRDLFKAKGLIK